MAERIKKLFQHYQNKGRKIFSSSRFFFAGGIFLLLLGSGLVFFYQLKGREKYRQLRITQQEKLAQQAWKQKKFWRAEAAYRELIQLAPQRGDYYWAAGEAAWQRGDYGAAENFWRRGLKQEPENADLLLGLMKLSIQLRDWENASFYQQKLPSSLRSEEKTRLEGELLLGEGKIEELKNWLEQGDDPWRRYFHFLLTSVTDFNAANEEWANWAEEDNLPPQLAEKVSFWQPVLTRLKEEGDKFYQKTLLTYYLLKQGYPHLSRSLLDELDSQFADYRDGQLLWATYFLQTNQLPEAEEKLKAALTLDPSFAPAYYLLARLAEEKGDAVKARSYFEQLINRTREKKYQAAYCRFLIAQGDFAAADDFLQKQLALPNQTREEKQFLRRQRLYLELAQESTRAQALAEVDKHPRSAVYLWALYLQGQKEKAKKMLAQRLSQGKWGQYLFLLARIYQEEGQPQWARYYRLQADNLPY